MTQTAPTPITHIMEREIQRFVERAAKIANSSLYRNRRASTRYHRAVPILYARLDDGAHHDESATLQDVSSDGLAFYCDHGLCVGSILAVKLFWSDTEAHRVPAIVRHCTITQQGFLIGAEFAVNHPDACRLIESQTSCWYG